MFLNPSSTTAGIEPAGIPGGRAGLLLYCPGLYLRRRGGSIGLWMPEGEWAGQRRFGAFLEQGKYASGVHAVFRAPPPFLRGRGFLLGGPVLLEFSKLVTGKDVSSQLCFLASEPRCRQAERGFGFLQSSDNRSSQGRQTILDGWYSRRVVKPPSESQSVIGCGLSNPPHK